MFDYIKSILAGNDINDGNEFFSKSKKLQIATCALFIEMAKADDDFTDDERNKIILIMESEFDLSDEETKDLLRLEEEKIRESISLYEFTTLVNENFSGDEKFELIKNLWRLVYADSKLNKYEDNTIKKIGELLFLEHKDIIGAKLMVKEEIGL